MGTNKEEIVNAPKTIERLEKISEERTRERREEEEEEDDDEKLVIHSTGPSIKLNELDLQDINKDLKLEPDPLLMDVEVLR